MRHPLIGLTLLGLLVAAPGEAGAQRFTELNIPPRAIAPFVLPDSISVRRISRDSLRHLLSASRSIGPSDQTCPMPVSRPDSFSTVPIPRARLVPNSAVPIPVDRTSCRNPLWQGPRER